MRFHTVAFSNIFVALVVAAVHAVMSLLKLMALENIESMAVTALVFQDVMSPSKRVASANMNRMSTTLFVVHGMGDCPALVNSRAA